MDSFFNFVGLTFISELGLVITFVLLLNAYGFGRRLIKSPMSELVCLLRLVWFG